jgi:hypothetical protein
MGKTDQVIEQYYVDLIITVRGLIPEFGFDGNANI